MLTDSKSCSKRRVGATLFDATVGIPGAETPDFAVPLTFPRNSNMVNRVVGRHGWTVFSLPCRSFVAFGFGLRVRDGCGTDAHTANDAKKRHMTSRTHARLPPERRTALQVLALRRTRTCTRICRQRPPPTDGR
jgi:hypothetical protein